MDQICQKVLLVLTQLGNQTSTSSTPPISFLSIKLSISITLYLKQAVRFHVSQNMIAIWELASWEARMNKSDLSSNIPRNCNSSFSKTTSVNSCIRFWIGAFKVLQDCYNKTSLVPFLTLARILPARSPSTTSFKNAFLFKKNCCMFNLSFLCRFDEKYHSATAPLVRTSMKQILHSILMVKWMIKTDVPVSKNSD